LPRRKPHTFSVETEWTGGIRTTTRARQHTVVADGPLWRHGTDDGPAPGELLLAAVGACFVNHLARYMQLKRMPVHGVSARVTGRFKFVGEQEVFDSFRFDVRVRAHADHRPLVERAFKVARVECTLIPILDVEKEFHLEFEADDGDA
jgi:uncharacterized OsmC-like protein